MNKTILVLALILTVPGITITAESLNKENLKVNFEIKSMKIKKVKGSFEGLESEVNFSASEPENASFYACIDASSVNTGNKKRDDHLRNEDYFHVEKYPTICFKSESVEEVEEGFLAKGQLTMMGVTREVEIPFKHENGELSGELNISRYDYNLASDVGTGKVSEEVKIFITYTLNN
ncbi:MAG: YceI family protein [Bacteroides sp.]|nr:YceI family protein [Bacteroides sp.]